MNAQCLIEKGFQRYAKSFKARYTLAESNISLTNKAVFEIGGLHKIFTCHVCEFNLTSTSMTYFVKFI